MTSEHIHVTEQEMIKYVNEVIEHTAYDMSTIEQDNVLARICACNKVCYPLYISTVHRTKVSRN